MRNPAPSLKGFTCWFEEVLEMIIPVGLKPVKVLADATKRSPSLLDHAGLDTRPRC